MVKPLMTVSEDVRNAVRSMKRGGETYDELLIKMMEQYDPEEAQEKTWRDWVDGW
jgi:predicted CopG family antitoxin